MKRLLVLLLVLLSLNIMVGCNNNESNNDRNSKKEQNNTTESEVVKNSAKDIKDSTKDSVKDIKDDKEKETLSNVKDEDAKASIKSEDKKDETIKNKEEDEKFYFGEWKINKYIYAGIGINDKEQIEGIIGKTVSFSNESANYFENHLVDKMNTIKNPSYKETEVEVQEYLNGYKASNDVVGFQGNNVQKIDIMDGNQAVVMSLIKDNNRLLIHLPGVFLELERVN